MSRRKSFSNVLKNIFWMSGGGRYLFYVFEVLDVAVGREMIVGDESVHFAGFLLLGLAQQLLRVAAGQALHELGLESLVEAPLLALETGLLGFRTFPLRERVSE